MIDNEQSVAEIVRKMEEDDIDGNTVISKYVTYSQRENIDRIDAYLNSKHISGDKDSMGRDKPFFNIVTAATNIWYRATDIDRSNIKVKATKVSQYTLSFIMSILLQEWMRKTKFGIFLNTWGRTLAEYGSSVVKFVEKDGELMPTVVPWNRTICDPVDFENNIKIEKFWYTPAQLRAKKEYDQGKVEDLIENKEVRETADGQKQDDKSEYIEIYEVHGQMPLSLLTGKESDEFTYVEQMHIISYLANNDNATNEEKYDDYTLYSGREAKPVYMITHLIKREGRTMSIGAVENLFETQWMMNHSIKSIKDQLDLSSKLIFQTSDSNFVGQNALTAIETGDIMIHAANQPLTQINNNSHDITSQQSFSNQWAANGQAMVNISESMMGVNPPSGSAWRQTQAILQESHSLFELMVENKGLDIERMLREYVIPHLKKKMDNSDEISAILEEHNLTKLDSLYVPVKAKKKVNDQIKKDILTKTPEDIARGNLISPQMKQEAVANEEQALQKSLNALGNERFIKPSDIKDSTWKDTLKDFEWDVEVDVTGEHKDTNAVMTTLTTALQTVASLQGRPMPPEMKVIFNRILEESGALSPIEINQAQPQPAQQPQQPAQPAPQLPEVPANQLTQ